MFFYEVKIMFGHTARLFNFSAAMRTNAKVLAALQSKNELLIRQAIQTVSQDPDRFAHMNHDYLEKLLASLPASNAKRLKDQLNDYHTDLPAFRK